MSMALFTMFARFATWRRLGVLLALLPLLVPGGGRSAIQAAAPHAQPAPLTLASKLGRAFQTPALVPSVKYETIG